MLAKKVNGYAGFTLDAIQTIYFNRAIKLVRPPKALSHIPHVPYFSYMSSLIKKENTISRNKRFANKLFEDPESNGLYLRPNVKGWEVVVTRPEDAKKLLFKSDIFPKADFTSGIDGTILSKFSRGPNLLFTTGAHWKAQRMVANPAFHRSAPVKLFGELTQKLFRVMDNRANKTVDITRLMEAWALDAIGLAGFDFDFNAIENPNSSWVRIYERVDKALVHPFYSFFPKADKYLLWVLPNRKQAHTDLDIFLKMIDNVIIAKKKALHENKSNKHLENSEKDLLTLMLESEAKGSTLSAKELRSNMCVFFAAGHETTANSLAYAIYFMAVNPDVQCKAREEAFKVLGDAQEDIMPTIEQTKSMDYINAVIKETLRSHSPALGTFARKATKDTELGGVLIPKDTMISMDIFNLHHNPNVWNNPDEFDPSRFLPGGEAEKQINNGFSWIPFGTGARQCIGMNFSLIEQRVMLSMMLRKFAWSLPEDSIHKDYLHTTNLVISSAKDLNINFEKLY
ncbi:CYP509 protein [Phycomyces blakesleeanus NRRL 1555(-)]|uniref:CYP509 protein n=1 Tax=Phycomyces blakesleeanus (strain ATCC 8743b / DSM 1359 / FGSC 10004 / NBRC 33097 / NRRL 1555) TaxID=763407 RepID=A0A162N493_PHYB8|nr:CYP509 protein [Phycomyces blakesleeanus NRRL 1555(-)]OAD68378.1 CYP509 protein [Phycomyces blakesleeanus NRRL 1555(-)]|eukprot:XP_018286418.1 CYP509 protein [Phycomyces blakesleeanus NRRL 1555(-)]